ncbi:GLPGLI family protein [Flavobacterium soli]|uniref:GLPGLI family protein n=1 Tax=Flavobacterium soli TaxID=344881 RepID=UPI000419881E|nr:GLPGLI family protein [Flavobacterium soli]
MFYYYIILYEEFFLAIVFFSFGAKAQTIKAIYSEKEIISNDRLNSMPEDIKKAKLAEMKHCKLFILQYSAGISFYEREPNSKEFIYEKTTLDENGSGLSQIKIHKKHHPFFYYKELDNNLMFFKMNNSEIDFNGKDKLIPWNWEISEETKIIAGYKCKKAISKAYNSEFTAWFTEEIPVNAGPDRFDGVPGLILYATSLGQEYLLQKVEILDQNSVIALPEMKAKTVTFLEMADIVTKKFSEDMKDSQMEAY